MFREKLTNFNQKRGYLYIRETKYIRDKRTLKRKPSKLCDGKATKERGKYSKKKDIYCGKIFETEPKYFVSFKEYIENQGIEYTMYKINSNFDNLIDDFVKYLLYVHEIDEDDFYNGKKSVYAIAEGYLSRETIKWLKSFRLKHDYDNPKEIQRFAYRCEDCAIFDEGIINTLYLKLVPNIKEPNIEDEINQLNETKKEEISQYQNLNDFIKKSI